MKKNIFTILPLLVLTFFIFTGDVFARGGRNIILVLDTSSSMVGLGGPDIFDDVKKALYGFVDTIKDGDNLTFVTFDAETRIYPTMLVDDDNDRDIIKKYISMTEADGRWTYMYDMLKNVYKIAADMEKETKRKTIIAIMTDGINDPPPHARAKRVNLDEIFSGVGEIDRFVYLVNFSDAKHTPWFVNLRDQIEQYGAKATLITAQDDPTAGIGEATDDITGITPESGTVAWPFILFVVFLGAVAVFIIYRRNEQLKVRGILECWESSVLNAYVVTMDLTKKMEKKVFIGKGPGTMFGLGDINVSVPFSIIAVRNDSEIKMKLDPGSGNEISYPEGQPGEYLEDGAVFVVANYTFRYTGD